MSESLKERYPSFSMILRSSKTYLYHKKNNDNNRFILENSSQQMIRTHYEVRMANDDYDADGLQKFYGVYRF